MLRAIIKKMEDREELPIEVSEIVDAIIEDGCEDEIYLKGVDADRSEIHGAFWRFIYRPGVYADPQHVAVIPYNMNDDIAWQRATCVKELMHLFDTDLERTNTDDEVNALVDRLLGRLSSDEVSLADLMAGKDKLAIYIGLPLLFPQAALQEARKAVKEGLKTAQEIAAAVVMPVELVAMMLDDEWDTLNGALENLLE